MWTIPEVLSCLDGIHPVNTKWCVNQYFNLNLAQGERKEENNDGELDFHCIRWKLVSFPSLSTVRF